MFQQMLPKPTGVPRAFTPFGSPIDTSLPSLVPPGLAHPAVQAPPVLEVERSRKALPTPPPSTTQRPSIWDREHISETLAGIGAGFFANGQSFGAGLGAAAKSLAIGSRQLREDSKKSLSYGGPDNQFEITTDPLTGARTVRQVPEFAAAAEAARRTKTAPTPKDNIDFRSRAVHAISQLPVEQRQAAYADLIANPGSYGVDTAGMPSAWSDQYGSVAGGLGLNVNQSISQDLRRDVQDHRVATDARRLDQTDRRLTQGDARVSQGAVRVAQGAERLRKSPPSTRRGASHGYSAPKSRAEYAALPSGSKYIAPDGSTRIKP